MQHLIALAPAMSRWHPAVQYRRLAAVGGVRSSSMPIAPSSRATAGWRPGNATAAHRLDCLSGAA